MKKILLFIFISVIGYSQNPSRIGATTIALTVSPIFTGNPTAPTPTLGDNDTSVATSAFVQSAITNSFSGNSAGLIRTTFENTNNTGASDRDIAIIANNKGLYFGVKNSTSLAELDNRTLFPFVIYNGASGSWVNYSFGQNGLSVNNINNSVNVLSIKKSGSDVLTVSDLGVLKIGIFTVATLPTPTGTAYATVSDALAPTYMATVVGGGSIVTPVFYNGTNWVSH